MTEKNAITIEPQAVPTRKAEPSKLYELRTLPGSPRQTYSVPMPSTHMVATIGLFRGVPQVDKDGTMIGPVSWGTRQRLTDAELADVKAWVARHFACVTGHASTWFIKPAEKIEPWDRTEYVPLAKFISIREIPANEQAAEVDTSTVNLLGETVG